MRLGWYSCQLTKHVCCLRGGRDGPRIVDRHLRVFDWRLAIGQLRVFGRRLRIVFRQLRIVDRQLRVFDRQLLFRELVGGRFGLVDREQRNDGYGTADPVGKLAELRADGPGLRRLPGAVQ